MSAFSAVDSTAEPARLISFLEQSAVGLAAMKHYMAVTHALRKPTAPVLDVGCGAGHDLTVLKGVGVTAVGVDPSSLMLVAAARRVGASPPQASGERLPFADDVFSGCWIERVLMHVGDPAAVIAEAVRCVQPNGVLTIFEPDWSTLAVNGSPVPTQWISIASHPSVGAVVGELLTAAGCAIRFRLTSWSICSTRRLNQAIDLGPVVAPPPVVDAWVLQVHRRGDDHDVPG